MPSAAVNLKTNDIISRVPEYQGVVGAIVIPAPRGPVGKPILCSGEADILRKFTDKGKVQVGYDLAFFSALTFAQKSANLYVCRPNTGAEYGAMIIKTSTATPANIAVATSINLLDPEAFAFTANDDAVLITGADPGSWNNNLSVAVVDNTAKQAGTFLLKVFYYGVLQETYLCSRNVTARDGNGRNIYVEDVLAESPWIRAVDNTAVAASVAIKYNPTTPVAFLNGDDGDPVTDGMMLSALNDLRDQEAFNVTLFLDGGRATATYGQGLATIAENRGDSIALLSVPYSAESSTTYMTDITSYVNTTLNLNTASAAIYTPHVQIYDRFNDRKLYVSPEAYAGAVISETADNSEIYFAPAGDNAAINVLDVRVRFTKGERDVLADARINPLRFTLGKGIRIWGQRTLLATEGAYLTRLNVKLLMITVEPAIMKLLDGFVFQFNDESTRRIIKGRIDNYMEGVKGKRGCVWFETICDESNNPIEVRNAYRIEVQLNVEPNTAGEQINFTRQLTQQGDVIAVASQ